MGTNVKKKKKADTEPIYWYWYKSKQISSEVGIKNHFF